MISMGCGGFVVVVGNALFRPKFGIFGRSEDEVVGAAIDGTPNADSMVEDVIVVVVVVTLCVEDDDGGEV